MNSLLTTVEATREIPYLQILFPEWIDNMLHILKTNYLTQVAP